MSSEVVVENQKGFELALRDPTGQRRETVSKTKVKREWIAFIFFLSEKCAWAISEEQRVSF